MSTVNFIKSFLQHSSNRGLDINSPQTTILRAEIIQQKGFLRRIYEEWYESIIESLPQGDGRVLELGSGAGFLTKYLPDLVTSEILRIPDVKVVLDGHCLPFSDCSLKAIVMVDVFHHLRNPRAFLHEAKRCVREGGVIVMIEPWVTMWSRFVYKRFHHEPFDPDSPDWEFPPSGPLSGANGALPWIVFERDRVQFEQQFPEWRILYDLEKGMPFRYILSGGISSRASLPE